MSQNDRAQEILKNAQKEAAESRRYNSQATRDSIKAKFEATFNGKSPYEWQIDATEAIILGLDCIVIAGTGAGKTMPFVMPLLLDENKDKSVIVISPLNQLEAEQVRQNCCIYFVIYISTSCNRQRDLKK
jgi:ATP-dependent helicase YprA (DUF1998 family)